MKQIRITEEQWIDEGEKRYGKIMMSWKFRCPACGNVACGYDYEKLKAPTGAIAYSCVGRWTKDQRRAFGETRKVHPDKPCDYSGGGLFKISPIIVQGVDGEEHMLFDFADDSLVK